MPEQAPKRLTLLSALALVGVAAGTYLSQLFYTLRAGEATGTSLCNINATFNCHAVASSKWAELFAGIPVSSAVAGWFIGIFFITLIARGPFWRRESVRMLLAATGFGCLFAVYLLFIMAVKLKTYCLFCMVIEVSLFASFGILLSLKPASFKKFPLDRDKAKKLATILGISLIVGIIILRSMDDLAGVPAGEISDMVEKVVTTPVLPVDVGSSPFEGAADAAITVVEFSDFQCPHCAHGVQVIKTLLDRYPGQLKVVFKNYPLDSGCNRKVSEPMHPAACEAARVADCAGKQGKFFAAYEQIFAEQDSLAPGKPTEIGSKLVPDPAKLAACVASTESGNDVTRDVEEGIRLNVESTPSFFINGHQMLGALPIPVWDQVIDRLTHSNAAH